MTIARISRLNVKHAATTNHMKETSTCKTLRENALQLVVFLSGCHVVTSFWMPTNRHQCGRTVQTSVKPLQFELICGVYNPAARAPRGS
eukprot:4766502-Amphidinium_carterae.1